MVNTTRSESKDVTSKAQGSAAREHSEGLLGLSGLTREAEVQEGSRSSPTMMQGRLVPGVTGIKCWVRGVDLADSSVLNSRLRWGREEVQGAWRPQHGPVTLPGAPFSPGDNSYKNQRILHRPKMLVSGLLQSTWGAAAPAAGCYWEARSIVLPCPHPQSRPLNYQGSIFGLNPKRVFHQTSPLDDQ